MRHFFITISRRSESGHVSCGFRGRGAGEMRVEGEPVMRIAALVRSGRGTTQFAGLCGQSKRFPE